MISNAAQIDQSHHPFQSSVHPFETLAQPQALNPVIFNANPIYSPLTAASTIVFCISSSYSSFWELKAYELTRTNRIHWSSLI